MKFMAIAILLASIQCMATEDWDADHNDAHGTYHDEDFSHDNDYDHSDFGTPMMIIPFNK